MATTAATDRGADAASTALPVPHDPPHHPSSSSLSSGGTGQGGPPKKYLCNAPRPNDYETKKDALLKSFGGDMTKLQRVARSTIRRVLKEKYVFVFLSSFVIIFSHLFLFLVLVSL